MLLNYLKFHNFCSKDDRNYGSCKPGPRVPQNTVIIIFPEDITGKITGQDVEEALLQKSLKVARKLYYNEILKIQSIRLFQDDFCNNHYVFIDS